jgi:hypothetical protein
MLYVESKKKKIENVQKKYPYSVIIDVTSKGEMPFVKFSPFYPVGGIPVPFYEGEHSESVEGIWQALKVFSEDDIDLSKLKVKSMSGIKRSVKVNGKVLGHRKGNNGELLNYIEARKLIYLPTYFWVLDNKLNELIDKVVSIAQVKNIVFLDYTTNTDIENTSKPLSHAGLLVKYLSENHKELLHVQIEDKNQKQLKLNL